MTAQSCAPLDEEVLRAVSTAMDCGVSAAGAVTVALGARAPQTIAEAIGFIHEVAPALSVFEAREPAFPSRLPELDPHLRLPNEIALIRRDVIDHELRGHLVFRDLVGKRSFFQVAALAIAGVDLSRSDADLLEHLGVNTQLADARISPLTVVRRAAARSGLAHGVLAGIAVALTPNMGARPVGAFMEVLERLDVGTKRGRSLEGQLEEIIARRERVAGVGRPVLGPDERNAQVLELVRTHGRENGRSWQLACAIDEFFHRRKGVRINAAGLQGAVMRDMGFSPSAAIALCILYFAVPILAQAVVAEEHLHRRNH